MHLDQVNPIPDLSPQTLLGLCQRIGASSTEEHRIYRECELDEAWRLIADGQGADDGLRRAVVQAHDMIGSDGDPKLAAGVLRAAIG